MTAETIAKALSGVKSTNHGFLCRCPLPDHGNGHGDHHRSLRVADGSNGNILVYCYSGCDSVAILKFLRSHGMIESSSSKPQLAQQDLRQKRLNEVIEASDRRLAKIKWLHRLGPDGLLHFLDETFSARQELLLEKYADLSCRMEMTKNGGLADG